MASKVLILFLSAPPDLDEHPRLGALAIDCESGEPVAIDRYSGGSPEDAVKRLQEREKWAWPSIVRGPLVRVPARQLYDFTDALRGRRMRRPL